MTMTWLTHVSADRPPDWSPSASIGPGPRTKSQRLRPRQCRSPLPNRPPLPKAAPAPAAPVAQTGRRPNAHAPSPSRGRRPWGLPSGRSPLPPTQCPGAQTRLIVLRQPPGTEARRAEPRPAQVPRWGNGSCERPADSSQAPCSAPEHSVQGRRREQGRRLDGFWDHVHIRRKEVKGAPRIRGSPVSGAGIRVAQHLVRTASGSDGDTGTRDLSRPRGETRSSGPANSQARWAACPSDTRSPRRATRNGAHARSQGSHWKMAPDRRRQLQAVTKPARLDESSKQSGCCGTPGARTAGIGRSLRSERPLASDARERPAEVGRSGPQRRAHAPGSTKPVKSSAIHFSTRCWVIMRPP